MRLSSIAAVGVLAATVAVLAACANTSQATPAAPMGTTAVRRSAVTERILHNFGAFGDGYDPSAAVVYLNGAVYGTTSNGGTRKYGTVYKVASSGKETVLHGFGTGSGGTFPDAKLINVDGTLYGTTYGGGAYLSGTVFSITPSGKLKIVYSFRNNGTDGQAPDAPLFNVGGTLYGTTFAGGAYNVGTVFSLTTSGKEKVLYSFAGGLDGVHPAAGLIDVNGILYGTTLEGGSSASCGSSAPGCGTAFSVTMTGHENVLHRFSGPPDGVQPHAGLTNVNGMIYGTTYGGGLGSCAGGYGCGTVFVITPSGKERVIYDFANQPDGAFPLAHLFNLSGTLYGTTLEGGVSGLGTVYSITTSGHETVLYSFSGGRSDGAYPEAGLIGKKTTLVGTTAGGGIYTKCIPSASGCGTLFSLSL